MFLIDIYGLFFLFGLVKLISSYQNLKSTCPKGYQGFWNFASPALVCKVGWSSEYIVSIIMLWKQEPKHLV